MSQTTDERGKLFVGGLSWETSHDTLLNFFSRYGEVIDCVVMKNPVTGKSRGFGFVTFRDPACVDLVLAAAPHALDGRQIDPKACNPRSMNKGGKNIENSRRKIFIGGLPTNITGEQLKQEFNRYGKVVDVVIMLDSQKQKSRGFGFLTFESEEAVESVVKLHFVEVNGKQVEVKRAEPRDLKMVADSGNPHSLFSLWPPHQWGLAPLGFVPNLHTWSGGSPVRGVVMGGNGTGLAPLTASIGAVNPLTTNLVQSSSLTSNDGIRLVSPAAPLVLINPGGGGVQMAAGSTNGLTSLQTLSPQAGATANAAAMYSEIQSSANPYNAVLDASDLGSYYSLLPSAAGNAASHNAAMSALPSNAALTGYTAGGLGLGATIPTIKTAGARTVLPNLSAATLLAYSSIDSAALNNASGSGLVAGGGGYGRILTNHITAVPGYHPYRR